MEKSDQLYTGGLFYLQHKTVITPRPLPVPHSHRGLDIVMKKIPNALLGIEFCWCVLQYEFHNSEILALHL